MSPNFHQHRPPHNFPTSKVHFQSQYTMSELEKDKEHDIVLMILAFHSTINKPTKNCQAPRPVWFGPLPVPYLSGLPRPNKWDGDRHYICFQPTTTKLFRSLSSPLGISHSFLTCHLPLPEPYPPPPPTYPSFTPSHTLTCPLPVPNQFLTRPFPIPYFYTVELDPIEIRLVDNFLSR